MKTFCHHVTISVYPKLIYDLSQYVQFHDLIQVGSADFKSTSALFAAATAAAWCLRCGKRSNLVSVSGPSPRTPTRKHTPATYQEATSHHRSERVPSFLWMLRCILKRHSSVVSVTVLSPAPAMTGRSCLLLRDSERRRRWASPSRALL